MLAVGSFLHNDPEAEHRDPDDERGCGDQPMDARVRRAAEHYEQPDRVEGNCLLHERRGYRLAYRDREGRRRAEPTRIGGRAYARANLVPPSAATSATASATAITN